jgi:hypothetical protein
MRGPAVVAQIDGEGFVMSAEAPAHRAPVLRGAEKTVQDDNGRAFSDGFEM